MALGQTLSGLLPVIGTGIGAFAGGPAGAAIGSGIGAFGQNLANDYFKQQSPAEQARAQLMQQLQGQAPYQRTNFDPIAQEELRRYRTETVPTLANQFAGLGGLDSSGFRQALSGSSEDLQTRLAALRAQHEMSQNQFTTGAEERRRQMLAGLSGGLAGEEQQQQYNQQQMMGNILGQVPSYMLQAGGLQNQVQQTANQRQIGLLQQLLSGLGQQQNIRQGNVGQAVSASQPIMNQAFTNFLTQTPTGRQLAARFGIDLTGQLVQAGGQLGAAALTGGAL
jgi:hypothetical protein